MYTQRKKDRRSFTGKTKFPLKTRSDGLIREERRSIPDRRLGNIQPELVVAEDLGEPVFFPGTFHRAR